MALGGTTNLSIIITAIDRASGIFKKAGSSLATTGAKMKSIGKGMTMGLTLPIVAMGAASVKMASTFDNSMTKSLAIMDATIEQEKEMEQVAREVAKSTAFSHSEAADAYFYLASAGLDANEAMASMPKVAEFAQAGAFDLARATDLLTDAQSALGLTIKNDAIANMKNMVRVSDVLVKANTLANGSVEQFSEALTSEAGAALKSFGIDVEEGVAVLAAFADQGVKGQVAGSGLSRVLRLLTKAANNNKGEMEALGISVYDSQGEIKNMADIIEDLEVAFDGMSDQQRTVGLESIGFSARIQGIILPLLGTSGAIRDYEKNLREAGGTTKDVSDKQLESFVNQMKKVKNNLVDAGITIGNVLMPYLLKLAKWITNLATKFEGLSPSVKKIIIVVGLVVAALGPLLMVLGLILPILPALGTAMTFLFTTPFGLAIAAVLALAVGATLIVKHWTPIKAFFSRLWESIKIVFGTAWNFIKMIFFNATIPGLIIKNWEGIKTFFYNIWEGVKGVFGSAIDWLMRKIQPFINAFETVKKGASWIGEKVGGVGETIGGAFKGAANWLKGVLPTFQEGGVVPGIGAQLAVVHGGETISPKGSAGDINIYIQGGNYLDREAGEKFADILGKMLRKELRYQKGY